MRLAPRASTSITAVPDVPGDRDDRGSSMPSRDDAAQPLAGASSPSAPTMATVDSEARGGDGLVEALAARVLLQSACRRRSRPSPACGRGR